MKKKQTGKKITSRGISETEAAQYIGVSANSLRQSRSEGRRERHMPPPPYIRLGRKIIYLKDDLDCWLEIHRIIP